MADYIYTQDWSHWIPAVWTNTIPLMKQRKNFLELGSYEGRSAVWTLENMLEDGGCITCVDTWGGGEEHKQLQLDIENVESRFDANIKLAKEKNPTKDVFKIKSTTYDALRYNALLTLGERFDFIYIDASHKAQDVLTDAVMAWPLLDKKGFMVFDDYMWGEPRDLLHRPKLAIDAFVNIFAEELEISYIGYQLIVRKK